MAQFQVECVASHTEKDNSQYSQFVLEPLDRGQGITIGNALRRVLLSNLEGAAVTAVRIAGVNHEFATIPGVREDVLDLMLNLKELVLKSYSSAPQIIRLVERGPKLVTATSFHSLPSDIEIVNPNQYIATLSEGATLEMELTIERGKGYRSVDRSKEDHSSPIDTLKIDAVFMPVRKVKYEIKDARIGDAINKESLLIDIWTNGSITPQEALSQAASVLVNLFSPLQEITLAPSLPQERDELSKFTLKNCNCQSELITVSNEHRLILLLTCWNIPKTIYWKSKTLVKSRLRKLWMPLNSILA
jgi:DNA-directed RNA polymerase subunit alpha